MWCCRFCGRDVLWMCRRRARVMHMRAAAVDAGETVHCVRPGRCRTVYDLWRRGCIAAAVSGRRQYLCYPEAA